MKTRPVLLSLLLTLAAPRALAQVDAPLLSKVQLNVVNPGGKSLAMGGAFVSLADDSTAAFANPAGLTQLASWQAGASGKLFRFEPELGSDGFFIEPSRPGTSYLGRDSYRPSDNASSLEYVSVVGPVGATFAVAAYRAVNLRYRVDTASASPSPLADYRAFYINVGGVGTLSLDEEGALDIEHEVWGLSGAAKLGPVSLGAGLTLSTLSYTLDGGSAHPAHQFVVNRDVPSLRYTVSPAPDVTSGSQLGWIVGALWQVEQRYRIAVGTVYRHSPAYDIDFVARYDFPDGTERYSCDGRSGTVKDPTSCARFKVPDDYSFGLSASPIAPLTVAVDVQRVLYSELNEAFVPLFAYSGCTGDIALDSCTGSLVKRGIPNGESDDATIVRAGAEWAFPLGGESTLHVRGGWYREPAHGTRVSLYPDEDGDRRPDPGKPPIELKTPPFSQAVRTSFDGGSPEDHVAFGIGAQLGRSFSADLGADLASSSSTVSVSLVYAFR